MRCHRVSADPREGRDVRGRRGGLDEGLDELHFEGDVPLVFKVPLNADDSPAWVFPLERFDQTVGGQGGHAETRGELAHAQVVAVDADHETAPSETVRPHFCDDNLGHRTFNLGGRLENLLQGDVVGSLTCTVSYVLVIHQVLKCVLLFFEPDVPGQCDLGTLHGRTAPRLFRPAWRVPQVPVPRQV